MLTASLPMYNLPEMRALNTAFWEALANEVRRDGLRDLPSGLVFTRGPVPDRIEPEVFFTQTCGYPLQNIYSGQYRLLGVPSYDAPGCRPARHCAFILVHKDSPYETPEDLKDTVFALNSRHSNSGMNLPRLLFARLAGGKPFFKSIVETGAHPASMARLAAREVDCASVDCMTYAFFKDHRPEVVESLRILAETPESPAIPFITSSATSEDDAMRLQAALFRLAADPARRSVMDGLRLKAITMADPAAYAALLDYERQAAELGYPELV